MKEAAPFGLIIIFSITGVFHLLVLAKVIPYTIIWGSRLKSDAAMYRFEIFSILVNFLFLMVVMVKIQLIPLNINHRFLNVILWLMLGMFILNTIANLTSRNFLEKVIFTPLTILLSVFILILLLC